MVGVKKDIYTWAEKDKSLRPFDVLGLVPSYTYL